MESELGNEQVTPSSIPVEKRSRKLVSRLSEVYDKSFEMQSERRPKPVTGTGVKLGDILRVRNAYQRNKLTGDLAKNVHLICYRSKGKATRRVTAIKQFNGFELEEIDKRIVAAEKLKLDELKIIGDLFNVPHFSTVTKKELIKNIVEYLQCPFETDSVSFRMIPLRQRRPKAVPGKAQSLRIVGIGKRKKPRVVQSVSSTDDEVAADHVSVISSASDPHETDLDNGDVIKTDEVKEEPSRDKLEEVSEEVLRVKIEAVLSSVDVDTTTVNQVVDRVIETWTPPLPTELVYDRRQQIKMLVKQIITEHLKA